MEELFIKYLVGSATEDERNLALSKINESVENQKYFDELKDYYQLTKIIQKPSGFNKDEGWNRVKANYYQNRFINESKNNQFKRIIVRYAVPVAASLLIAFILGFLLSNSLSNNSKATITAYNEIKVPLGAKSQVTLSDGTKVWLNAGSKLRYPIDLLNGKNREVYLEGEAFFDVTKMNKKLFIVKTSKLNIKVFGTQFNVKSYPEENLIQTTLVKGSVAIEANDKPEKGLIYLKPNQTATYYKSEKSNSNLSAPRIVSKPIIKQEVSKTIIEPLQKMVVLPKVDPLPITSWKDTRWVIVGEELAQLTVKLERRYNVKITIDDEDLKTYKFSGTLAEETFEQVLKIIQISSPIKYSIQGNNVHFSVDPLYKKNYDKMISKQ